VGRGVCCQDVSGPGDTPSVSARRRTPARACGHTFDRRVDHLATLAGMRLVIARCEVEYTGRLSAHLPLATRLIMVKADGCVAVHSDEGAYKPLNWMNAPNHLEEGEGEWVVTNRAGERLVIHFAEVLSDSEHPLGPAPGLNKDGVEAELQRLLADAPQVIEEGLSLLRREYPSDLGPVDLLCRDAGGQIVAVEVKRRGEMDGVEQLARYLERLNRDPALAPVRGILAAQTLAPQARTLAAARGIGCVEIDYDALRGVEGNSLRLF
jgi:RecB family endonuclease NucS